jgi:maltose alpha-D-glucosyltransferase/alpha-amylase
VVAVTNLGDRRRTVDLGPQPGAAGDPVEVFSDRAYDTPTTDLKGVEVAGYGYRWIRLRETPGR